jgi:hypothetical protein
LSASNIICYATSASTCNQPLFAPTQFLDWGAVGSADYPVSTNPFVGTTSLLPSETGTPVSVTATGNNGYGLQRQDNTVYTWNNGYGWWVYANQNGDPNIVSYGGHFDAPSQEADGVSNSNVQVPSSSAYQYGDNLLTAVATVSTRTNNPGLTLTFGQNLSFVEFQVSSLSGLYNQNFVAVLTARDSHGNVIGYYAVDDRSTADTLNADGTVTLNGAANLAGYGGLCGGLNNPGTPIYGDPTPCNDAPLIQFYDPQGRIKSVDLTVYSAVGLAINTLQINPTPPPEGVPEPTSARMCTPVILGLLLAVSHRKFRLSRILRAFGRC